MSYEVNRIEDLELLADSLPDFMDKLREMFAAGGKMIFFEYSERQKVLSGDFNEQIKKHASWCFNNFNYAIWIAICPKTSLVLGNLSPDHGDWPIDEARQRHARNVLPESFWNPKVWLTVLDDDGEFNAH